MNTDKTVSSNNIETRLHCTLYEQDSIVTQYIKQDFNIKQYKYNISRLTMPYA